MTDLIKKNSLFLVLQLFILIALIPVLLLYTRVDIHIFLNQYNSVITDYFFRYITMLGSGFAPVIFGLVFLFISFRKSFQITCSGLLAGFVVQLLKRLVFPGIMRPVEIIESSDILHLIEGVELHSKYSFPSGHSATIFALCFCLAFFSEKALWKFVLFCLAIMVAYSRIYLSQHFLIDVYTGSVIGVLSALIIVNLFSGANVAWFDKSLITLQNNISDE